MYAAGDPSNIRITAYIEEGYQPPQFVELSRLPAGSRSGYLAGEHPDGLTTLDKDPASATVRALLRDEGGPNDGCLIAQTQSTQSGEWIISGLNPAKRYDVVGRLEGHNDVIVANVQPAPFDRMFTAGQLKPNIAFNGMDGALSVVGGVAPFAMQVVTPPPDGLTLALDRRDILVIGTTTAAPAVYTAEIIISDGSGLTLAVEIEIPTSGVIEPANFAGELAKLFKPTRFDGAVVWEPGGPESKAVEDVMKPPAVYYVTPKWDPTLHPPGDPHAFIARLFKPTRFTGSIVWQP